MEVTPELFAWFGSLGIIDATSSLRESGASFMVPEKTLEMIQGGKYMDRVISNLEDAYNNFYDLNFHYTNELDKMKPISTNEDYVSHSVKFFNWNIIKETLNHFGITINNEVDKISNGDNSALIDVIQQIFSLTCQMQKKVNEGNNLGNKSMMDKSTRLEPAKRKSIPMSATAKVKDSSSINLTTFNPDLSYTKYKTPLEFLIASLCKNFSLKPRQAVALLSNNRKYLMILNNKGVKGKFDQVKLWLNDVDENSEILTKMLKIMPGSLEIAYAIIGSALCSKSPFVSVSSCQLLKKINYEAGVDWNWMTSEGIDAFIFTIIKNDEERVKIINIFYELISKKLKDFILELKKRIIINKNKIFDFISCVVPVLKETPQPFSKEFEDFAFNSCISETSDTAFSVSTLCAIWYYAPLEEEKMNTIVQYIRNIVRSQIKEKCSLVAIAQLFNLVTKFGDEKNEYGPVIYKMLTGMLMDNYDNENKREFLLAQFEKFLNTHQTVPIDIILEPYLDHLKSNSNFALCDIVFVFKMAEHPRMTSPLLLNIVEFSLNVTLHSLPLQRSGNLILRLLFEKKIPQKILVRNEIGQIKSLFVDYIKTVLNLFIQNLKNSEDTSILETAYDIMNEMMGDVNAAVRMDVINCVTEYRKQKGKNSNSLLAMLWIFNDHDDILMQNEEKFRRNYEPVVTMLKKEKKIKDARDKKDFKKKQKNVISSIVTKQQNKEVEKEKEEIDKTLKSNALRKSLMKQRERKNIMLGIEPEPDPEPETAKNIEFPARTIATEKKKKGRPREEVQEETQGGTLQVAITEASEHYGLKKNNSVVYTNPGKKEKRERKEARERRELMQMREEKEAKDDVIKKFGTVLSVDKKREIQRYNEQMRLLEKLQSSKKLILPEGTLGIERRNDFESARSNYITSEVYKNFIIPVDLEFEEDREIKAIKGYNEEYDKSIKLYFRAYYNERTQLISRSGILKMFREKGFTKNEIDLEELSIAIRNYFGENLNELSYEMFCSLLVQLSFLIFHKKRETLTISECYGNLLRHFNPTVFTEATAKMTQKMRGIIKLLKQKMLNPKDDKDADFNLPPGFKIRTKTFVKYNNRLAPHFLGILGESKYICYEMVEEILFNVLNSSILEPYVTVKKTDDIEVSPTQVRNWSNAVTIGYINLGSEYKKIGEEVADILETGLRKLCQGRDTKGNIFVPPLTRKIEMERQKYFLKEEEREKKRMKRKLKIDQEVKKYKEEKEMKRAERNRKIKQLRKEVLVEREYKKRIKLLEELAKLMEEH